MVKQNIVNSKINKCKIVKIKLKIGNSKYFNTINSYLNASMQFYFSVFCF